jgi:hypothetical protein
LMAESRLVAPVRVDQSWRTELPEQEPHPIPPKTRRLDTKRHTLTERQWG